MKFEVHFKEKVYFGIMACISIIIYLFVLSFITLSMLVFYTCLGLVVKKITSLFFIGRIKGNSIKLNQNQFADVYAVLKSHCKALEMDRIPEIYVLQGDGVLNAFATRASGRDFIVMYSDVLEAAYQEGMDAVSFIMGHELGHIKRKHLSFVTSVFTFPASFVPLLSTAYSRSCEYTCDAIGYSLCSQGAAQGLLVLAAGKQLHKKVNIKELLITFETESKFAINLAELFSTHPVLAKRLKRIEQLNRENTVTKEPFVSPLFDWRSSELQQ